MHYYQFNIGDYTKRTARLSPLEDIAYRRLLDQYYLNERPFNESEQTLARDIGMAENMAEVTYILDRYFPLINEERINSRADEEIRLYKNKKKTAAKAGKASGKARQGKASERVLNERLTDDERPIDSVEPTNNHKPITINQEPLTKNQELVTNNQKTVTKKPNGKDKTLVELKPDDAKEIFEYWQKVMNHPRAAFDNKRKTLIKKWFKHYSVDDLKKAIKGCSITPHNMGENKEGRVYDSIELILRDAKHIDDYMRNADKPPASGVTTIQQTQDRAQQQAERIKKQLGWNQ